jgi:hypothetical protein
MGYGEKSCDVRHHLLGPSISGKCLNNRKKIRLATFVNKLLCFHPLKGYGLLLFIQSAAEKPDGF